MKIIVFGGSGFLGSNVADALTDAGHDVVIYDLVASLHLKPSQRMVVGDIMDERKVEETVEGADAVYNFAGVADIGDASRRPVESVRFNILGNTNILEACRKSKVGRFVFASSVYVYPKAGSFYRSTKQACELLIENYHETWNLEYTILRYGSLYGPRCSDRNFIYQIIRQALKEGRIVREGDGEEIREYIHVYDAAKISADILSKEYANQYVIVTGDQQMKMKDFLLMVREMLDNKVAIEYTEPTVNYHYEITPYTFAPKLAKRIVNRTYLDLGQGLLECMQNVYKELHEPPTRDGAVSRSPKTRKGGLVRA
jgi:UDP-glucose 4-epimerase